MGRQDFVCNGESIYCHSHFTIMSYTRHNLIKINIFRTSQSTDIYGLGLSRTQITHYT